MRGSARGATGERLPAGVARRIALAAPGFAGPRPWGTGQRELFEYGGHWLELDRVVVRPGGNLGPALARTRR